MPPAVIAGGVAAAGAIGGAAINAKAAKKASKAQAQSTAEQTAVQREIYAQNKAALSPFMQRGNMAGDTINALLGLGGSTAPAQPNALDPGAAPTAATPAPFQKGFDYNGDGKYTNARDYLYYATHRGDYVNPPVPAQAPPTPAQSVSPQQAAMDAYNIFKQSTGYQTRLNEGYSALNAGWAGRGMLQSGAAVKSALRYGQDYASNEFGKYLGYLGNQQSVGLQGAGALAGVGVGYANAIGDISQNQANATAANASFRAANTNSLISGLAGAAGNIAGGLSSYGGSGSPLGTVYAGTPPISPGRYPGYGLNSSFA